MTTVDSRMTPADSTSQRTRLSPFVRRLLRSQQFGLVGVIVALLIALSLLAGSHIDAATGQSVNNFLNSHTLIQTATDASFFAIMAVGATIVIISGGIDLSVGSVYALAGVSMGLILRVAAPGGGVGAVLLAFIVCVAVGIAAGALNGAMVVGLRVHPFIITLGSMWILRGIAFVASKAESILLPESLTRFAKSPLGPGRGALSGSDVVHAGRERAGGGVSAAHGDGAARVRAGRERRRRAGFPGCGSGAYRSACMCSPGSPPAWRPSSDRASTARSPLETRTDMSYT